MDNVDREEESDVGLRGVPLEDGRKKKRITRIDFTNEFNFNEGDVYGRAGRYEDSEV